MARNIVVRNCRRSGGGGRRVCGDNLGVAPAGDRSCRLSVECQRACSLRSPKASTCDRNLSPNRTLSRRYGGHYVVGNCVINRISGKKAYRNGSTPPCRTSTNFPPNL